MEDLSKVIAFQLKEQQYGFDIQQVMSIEKFQDVTKIPKTSDFIKGVINLRGEIIPIIDLRERLDLGKINYTGETRVLIVCLHNIQVGLIVDSATDVIDIDPEVIEPAPRMTGEVNGSFLHGVAKLEDNLLILLDLKHILNLEEINEVEQVIEE